MFTARRLLLITALVVAPILAACSSPTGIDNNPPANTPADTAKFDIRPWG